jgi:cytochrome c551/c552
MLRSIAELAAYGTLAALLTAASFSSHAGATAGSAATSVDTTASHLTIPVLSKKAAAERGALLFATKGCIGCHVHAAFPSAHMQIGPELTGLPLRAATRVAGLDASAYVRQSLREPGAYRAPTTYPGVMPDLALSDADIEALTVFLLTPMP